MSFEIKTPVDPQRIADLMTSAIEGGSGYWLGSVEPVYNKHEEYSEASAYGEDMVQRIFRSDDDDYHGTLAVDTIQRGLDLLGTVAGGRHLAAFLSENDDAETADVFLQLTLFGDIIYG